MTLHIYTDGACEPNPGPGGWGVVVYENDKEIHSASGGVPDTTNNIMEMTGMLQGIRWWKENRPDIRPLILSDSRYVIDGCNSWRFNWKKNGWKRKRQELKNAEIWQQIDAALDGFEGKILWVKAHVGIPGNERADALANIGMLDALEASANPLDVEYRAIMGGHICQEAAE